MLGGLVVVPDVRRVTELLGITAEAFGFRNFGGILRVDMKDGA